MKITSTSLAVLATFLPVVWSLPASFEAPTCAAASCLTDTNGLFHECAPKDFGCLCKLEQSEVTRYVTTVQPCLDGEGHTVCTDGAIYQYKDLLKNVCADSNKTVEFPPTT